MVGPGAAQGAYRLLGPLITWMGRRQEQRIWTSLKQHLELGLMVGVEILARAAWSCLPGGATRPRALAGVVVAHEATRA
jgi:hypothetical protein